MARVLSFVDFGGERCCFSPSLDYSPLAAAPSPRAASPEYTPVSLRWRLGTPEHAPSTTLRLGPPMLPPLRGPDASPDYSPSSSPSRPASPENRCGWRTESPSYTSLTHATSSAASPDYMPSTPTYRVASPEYTPVSRLWRAAGSPDYEPSSTPTYRAASPEYTPVSRLWTAAGLPDCAPASPPRRAASPVYAPRTPPARAPPPSPDYSPSTPLPSPPVSDAESGTSPARRFRRRRHHPYQRGGTGACTFSACGINHGQRHLVY